MPRTPRRQVGHWAAVSSQRARQSAWKTCAFATTLGA
eukprot:CAMPEP_0174729436 /NCGR_PEP_ID=MMETSP1094-20130205/53734_1 /TAXON_ID=156173 /ORGANISM="Chrysochromulina brevifilum, Strain UTEX LB 985" /LENGTH=36 /DNA_ID= /DNA_START= /DNA_END= /DNA_ORIENTATION=